MGGFTTVAAFMQGQIFAGFPVRGAIAYGEFTYFGGAVYSGSVVRHYTLASKAQVLARNLESQQEWAGCVLHDTVLDRCDELSISLSKLEDCKRIIKYKVPFKENKDKEMYALIFMRQREQFHPERKILNIYDVIKASFESNGKQIGEKEILKIKNTAKFVNYVFPVTHTK